MSRLIACLLALGALLGLLGMGVASARGIPAMAAMRDCGQPKAMPGGPMHHGKAAYQPKAASQSKATSEIQAGCEDCPMTGSDAKPCNAIDHCLAMSGTALVLPAVLPLASMPSMAAQRHERPRAAELSGLAAPPFTEPPILTA